MQQVITELFSPEQSLILPTLLDLMAHSAPDGVLGDGGSLYLKLDPPLSEAPASCVGCSHGKEQETNGCSCDERAYLVATTRDHPRIRIGHSFYCTRRERYTEVGNEIKSLLTGVLHEVHERLASSIWSETAAWRSGTGNAGSAEAPLAAAVLSAFKELFCPRGDASDCPAMVTQTIRQALRLETLNRSGFSGELIP